MGAVTVGYVAVPGPLLCTPMLADTAAEAVDARTVQYLFKAALVLKKKQEEMMMDIRRFRADLPISDAEWEAWQAWRGIGSSSSAGKRKRKRRSERKLPKSSSSRSTRGRARRRQRQWHAPGWFSSVLAVFPSCRQAQVPQHIGWYGPEGQFHGRARYVLAGFPGDDAFRVVFSSVVGWHRCSASWPVCTRRTSTRSLFLAVACARLVFLVHDVRYVPFGFWQARDARHHGRYGPEGLHQVRRHPRRGAQAVSHGPDCSSDHRHSPFAEHGGRCPCCAVLQVLTCRLWMRQSFSPQFLLVEKIVGFPKVIDIPVVAQVWLPTVLQTIEIVQLHVDMVMDVPSVQLQQVPQVRLVSGSSGPGC